MNNKTGEDKLTTNQDLPTQVKKWVEEQGIDSMLSQDDAIKDVIEFEKNKYIKPTDEVDF